LPGETIRVESIPDVVQLREKVSHFLVCLLWLHVPIVVAMAIHSGTNVAMQTTTVIALGLLAWLAVRINASGPVTRLIVAFVLTCMPILIVYNGVGPWQIDYHMYFFAIFAMLVAYCDWRPIVVAAVLTIVQYVIFDIVDPTRVFPGDAGLDRVALHAAIVAVECGVLLWTTLQLRRLFLEFATTRQIADRALLRADEVTHLRHEVSHDHLTGVGNRPALLERMQVNLGRTITHPGYHFAVLFLDLDDFKKVNDRLGHVAGDALLVSFTARLTRCIRSHDSIARLGGDEFIVILDDVVSVLAAEFVAERIVAEMKKPFDLDGHAVVTSASIGIAFSAGHTGRLALLRDADAALYRAKKATGKGSYATFGRVAASLPA
jgi:diguanylate cyclase (GGDEF)-like protein